MSESNLAQDLLSRLAVQGIDLIDRPVPAGARVSPLQDGRSVVTLVLEGAAARQGQDSLCLGLAGPGDLLNFDAAVGGDAKEEGLWLTPGREITIPAERLGQMTGRPALIETALMDLRRRIQAAHVEVTRQARGRVTERLASLLLDIHHLSQALEIPLRQSDIADLLSVRRAGISTAGGELQAVGAIRVGRAAIRLCDLDALEKMAAVGSPREQATQSPMTDLAGCEADQGRPSATM
jgi:CRP-like cAMP-binding protein